MTVEVLWATVKRSEEQFLCYGPDYEDRRRKYFAGKHLFRKG